MRKWLRIAPAHPAALIAAAALLLSCPPAEAAAPTEGTEQTDVAPGKRRISQIEQWTREGGLGTLPSASDKRAPLSDQANQAGWVFDDKHSDEFFGDELETDLWSRTHRTWKGRRPARFSSNNVEVSEGMLHLWMRKDGPPKSKARRGFHTYTSAAVQAKHPALYGYFEVRAKPMDSAGSSSFWFANNDDHWWTEIDVFEIGGKAVGHEHRFNMNLHVFRTPKENKHWNVGDYWVAPFRLADDFHVYGLEWTPKRLTYFVDGVPVRWVSNTDWSQPLYLIFDTETMIDWLGVPRDEDLPSDYQIDYVRAWRLPEDRTPPASRGT